MCHNYNICHTGPFLDKKGKCSAVENLYKYRTAWTRDTVRDEIFAFHFVHCRHCRKCCSNIQLCFLRSTVVRRHLGDCFYQTACRFANSIRLSTSCRCDRCTGSSIVYPSSIQSYSDFSHITSVDKNAFTNLCGHSFVFQVIHVRFASSAVFLPQTCLNVYKTNYKHFSRVPVQFFTESMKNRLSVFTKKIQYTFSLFIKSRIPLSTHWVQQVSTFLTTV